jgi:hypothetical protein
MTLSRLYNSNPSAALTMQSSKVNHTSLESAVGFPRVLAAVASLLLHS